MPRKESISNATAQQQQDANSEGIDAYDLPRSLVMRIARSGLPDNVKLQKETVLALLKGSTVFVNYIAATAHDVAASKQHKSVSASDVLKALEMTQFGDMVDKLQEELKAYRELHKSGRSGKTHAPASASAKGKEVASGAAADTAQSISAAKGKGKEKATAAPSITIPGAASRPVTEQEPAAGDDDEEMVDEEAEEENELENDIESEDEVEYEVDDPMALEEEELQRDARALDGSQPGGGGQHHIVE